MKRILVWGLSNNRAGTEAVINNYVSRINDISFDFLCYEEPLNYSNLFVGTNNRYYVIPLKIKHPISYKINLERFMKIHHTEYSTVWCNINDVSNIDLLILAKRYGIKRRIVHMHNSRIPDVFITQLFSKLNWRKCLKLATDKWACSEEAGCFLYGLMPFKVIPNMVNADACAFDIEKRMRLRGELGFDDSYVIGNVGRLDVQKNQQFLIKILPNLLKNNPKTKLLFVGEGPLKKELQDFAYTMGVSKEVVFCGAQSDIQGYLSVFDIFAFPSLYEGLSLSILEAQFNGLPCIISEGVGRESVISNGTTIIDLKNEKKWTEALLKFTRDDATLNESASRFDIANIDSIINEMFRK